MSDLIRRSDAIKAIEKLSACEKYGEEFGTDEETYIGKYEAITEISDLPSARAKGKWMYHRPPDDWVLSLYSCSECGHIEEGSPHFCPACGAYMKGADE